MNATDVFGGVGVATATTEVQPPSGNITAMQNIINSQLQNAYDSGNNDLVAQVVGAVTGVLNSKNCSATPASFCKTLHRTRCSQVANTCGPCEAGYFGSGENRNNICRARKTTAAGDRRGRDARITRPTAAADAAPVTCNVDDDCPALSSCEMTTNQCVPDSKTCPSDCSQHGSCRFVNALNHPTTTCYASNSYCRALCHCDANWYGNDCSLSLSDFSSKVSVRESLCVGLYSTLTSQDASTPDVINSRMNSVTNVFSDITQISDIAMSRCAATVMVTIQKNPALAGDPLIASGCVSAISSVSEYLIFNLFILMAFC